MAKPYVLDLNEMRAARAEVAGPPPIVKLGEKQFKLPQEMPLTFPVLCGRGEIEDALRLILDDQFEDFLAEDPTMEDLLAIAEGMAEMYGVEVGKVTGSSQSLVSDGASSKPTSKGSTGSTSGAKSKRRASADSTPS